MKCLIVRDCCPFHLALHGKHSCQGGVQLSDGPLALRAAASATGRPPACHPGWPLAPIAQPQLPRTLTPCQRVERLGTYSPWRFLFGEKKRKMPLTVSAWGAIEHVKTLRPRIAWHVVKWEREEGREEDTSNKTSNVPRRDERWEGEDVWK